MPDDSDPSEKLQGRHRPNLSKLSKETTEEDLWDLDEEDTPPLPLPPVQSTTPLEPNKSRAKEPKESKGPKPEPEPKSTEPARKINAEPRSKPKAGTARKPKNPAASEKPKKTDLVSSVAPRNEPDQGSAKPEGDKVPSSPTSPTPEGKPADEPDQPSPKEPEPKKEASSSAEGSPSEKLPIKGSEKIGLVGFAVVVLGIAIWWSISLFSSIPTTRLGDDQPELPAEGTHVTVVEVESYWREPIRGGENADVARAEAEFIPVLKLEIEAGKTGVLRVIFRNTDGDFVGDSISQSFTNGAFSSSGENSVEFAATDGFGTQGEFNGYRVGDERWSVEVFEGPAGNAAGSDFKRLLTAPVSPNRQ